MRRARSRRGVYDMGVGCRESRPKSGSCGSGVPIFAPKRNFIGEGACGHR